MIMINRDIQADAAHEQDIKDGVRGCPRLQARGAAAADSVDDDGAYDRNALEMIEEMVMVVVIMIDVDDDG